MSLEEINKHTVEETEKTSLRGSSELLPIHTKGTESMENSAGLIRGLTPRMNYILIFYLKTSG